MATTHAAEILRRIDIIYGMLLDGYTTSEIIRYGTEKFCVSERQIEKYIRKANQKIEEFQHESQEKLYNKAVQRTAAFYRKCLASGDKRTAMTALKELNDIQGLKVQKLEHTGKDGGPIESVETIVILPDNGFGPKPK